MNNEDKIRNALESETFRNSLKSTISDIYKYRNRNVDCKKCLIMKCAVAIADKIQKHESQRALLSFFISGEKFVAETLIMLSASKSNNEYVFDFAKDIMLPAYELIANTAKSLLKIKENDAKICEKYA